MKQRKQVTQSTNLDECPIYRYPAVIDEDYMWEYYMCEDYVWTDDDYRLEESDFYPPTDDRVWESNIEDIEGGDNFVDFCKEFFKMLDEEGYWD